MVTNFSKKSKFSILPIVHGSRIMDGRDHIGPGSCIILFVQSFPHYLIKVGQGCGGAVEYFVWSWTMYVVQCKKSMHLTSSHTCTTYHLPNSNFACVCRMCSHNVIFMLCTLYPCLFFWLQLLGPQGNALIGQALIDVDDLGDTSIILDAFGNSFQDRPPLMWMTLGTHHQPFQILFRSGRISSVYIVGCWLVGCGWVTLFQNLFILSVVVL